MCETACDQMRFMAMDGALWNTLDDEAPLTSNNVSVKWSRNKLQPFLLNERHCIQCPFSPSTRIIVSILSIDLEVNEMRTMGKMG